MPEKKLKQAGTRQKRASKKRTSTVTPDDLIAEARKYVGVQYKHQGRGTCGLDCGGLLLVIGKNLGLTELEFLGYSMNPDGETFGKLLDQELDRVKGDVQPGDIIACDYGDGIQHTGVVVRRDSPERVLVIHAKRKWGVVEQYLHGVDRRGWVRTYRVRGM